MFHLYIYIYGKTYFAFDVIRDCRKFPVLFSKSDYSFKILYTCTSELKLGGKCIFEHSQIKMIFAQITICISYLNNNIYANSGGRSKFR